MDESRKQALRRLVLILDGLLIVVAMGLSVEVHRLLRTVLPALRELPEVGDYALVAFLALPLMLFLVAMSGLHRIFDRRWSRAELLWSLLRLHLLAFVALSAALFLTRSVINRTVVFAFLGCSFALFYLERSALSRWQRLQHATGQGRLRLLLIGSPGPTLQAFTERLRTQSLPPLVVGRVAPGQEQSPAQLPGIPLLGTVDELPAILHRESVDEVLFFAPLDMPQLAVEPLRACELVGVPAGFALPRPEGSPPPRILWLYDQGFVAYEVAPKNPALLALKHGFDAVAAAALLFLFAPLLICAALGIWLTMGRPIFFRQERAGLFGRRFAMLKFRTMARDAEARQAELQARNEMSGPVFKVTADPRITPFGRWLRRTSVDELPQLFHVLRGTMSLVGPRPLPTREQQEIRGWHRRRLSMKPGLTGLWQVSGRNDIDFEQWMRLDLHYVDHWSLGLDLWVLARTLPAVVFGTGAR